MKTIKIINGRRQNMFEPINQINTSNFYKILPESKSSLRQDMFVLNEFKFKRDGYFIELGAADGFDSSNTHLLEYKFNWKGSVCGFATKKAAEEGLKKVSGKNKEQD